MPMIKTKPAKKRTLKRLNTKKRVKAIIEFRELANTIEIKKTDNMAKKTRLLNICGIFSLIKYIFMMNNVEKMPTPLGLR